MLFVFAVAVMGPILLIQLALIFFSYAVPVWLVFYPVRRIKKSSQLGKATIDGAPFFALKVACYLFAYTICILVFSFSKPFYSMTGSTWCTI